MGTSPRASAGEISSASTPQDFAAPALRLRSRQRSGVAATSRPPTGVEAGLAVELEGVVQPDGAARELRHHAGEVGLEHSPRGVRGGTPGLEQGALVDDDDVAPAELRQVVDGAAAGDAGADDDQPGAAGDLRCVGHVESRQSGPDHGVSGPGRPGEITGRSRAGASLFHLLRLAGSTFFASCCCSC